MWKALGVDNVVLGEAEKTITDVCLTGGTLRTPASLVTPTPP